MAAPYLKPRSTLPRGLTVDQFLDWYEEQPQGRFELHHGDVVSMAAERVGHANRKGDVYVALRDAIRAAGVPCQVLPDGVAVHVSDTTWYEPDVLVYFGPEAPTDDIRIENPMIVVEVESPSTKRLDAGGKLAGYFDVPSVVHYLIVTVADNRIVHHRRQDDGTILTRIVTSGPLLLDPPGLTVDLTEVLS
jgi:Uma2 family endonuclease